MMRAGAAVLAAALVACGGERDDRSSTGATAPASAAAATTTEEGTSKVWWQPALGTTWQWQLQGELNVSYAVDVYDIDLFDSTPALIEGLHRQGRRVVCYLSAGSAEDWRDDFDRFDEADIGEPLDDWEGERWLDIRSPDVHAVMLARLDLAREKRCDGVEPDNVQGYEEATGFSLTYDDQIAYNRMIATAAHQRGLAVGLKNGGPQVADLLDVYDFALTEECQEHEECDPFEAFIAAGKPVLHAEYRSGRRAALELAESVCPPANGAGFRTLILPVELDDEFRVSCFD